MLVKQTHTSEAFKKISVQCHGIVSHNKNFTGEPKTVFNNHKPSRMDQDERKKRKITARLEGRSEREDGATNISVRIHISRWLIL